MTSKSKLMSFIAERERRNQDPDIAAFKKRSGYDLEECCELIETIGKDGDGNAVIRLKRKKP